MLLLISFFFKMFLHFSFPMLRDKGFLSDFDNFNYFSERIQVTQKPPLLLEVWPGIYPVNPPTRGQI